MTRDGGPRILYDLSPTVTEQTAVWPGDTAYSFQWTGRLGIEGSPVNLSTVTTTVHLSSHADAPLHTEPAGETIDRMALDLYLGPCRVVRTRAGSRPGGRVAFEDLIDLGEPPPRVLIDTGSFSPQSFDPRFRALEPALAERLHALGVRLIGTDSPSVDPFESKELEAHHAILGRGIAILEGLELGPVPAGDYELIALPLKLGGLDGSPVRAVLRELERG